MGRSTVGDFSGMFHKKTGTFSIRVDVIETLLRGASSTSHAVSEFEVYIFFGHIVANMGWRVL